MGVENDQSQLLKFDLCDSRGQVDRATDKTYQTQCLRLKCDKNGRATPHKYNMQVIDTIGSTSSRRFYSSWSEHYRSTNKFVALAHAIYMYQPLEKPEPLNELELPSVARLFQVSESGGRSATTSA